MYPRTDRWSQTLTGIGDLPQLQIVPVANLVLHEHHDQQRTPPLIKKLQASGFLRNPPVVIQMQKQSDHYMVLDGANRVSAFRELAIPYILVQVIDPEVDQVELNAWNHVIWGISPDDLFNSIHTLPDVYLQPSRPSQSFQDLMDIHSLASLHLPDKKVFTVFTPCVDVVARIKTLNEMVHRYCKAADVDRTIIYEIDSICDLYDDLAGLVMLPTFDLMDVLSVVEAGFLMPPGSTRFKIAPRVLHVNYYLDELAGNTSLAEKNIKLREYLCACLASKCVRFYAEPTFLFDE